MTIPEEVPKCLFGWCIRVGGVALFFRNLGNPLVKSSKVAGGSFGVLGLFRNASIGNTNSKDIRFSPHFSKQEGFLGQTFGCFFLDYCIRKRTRTNSAQLRSVQEVALKWNTSKNAPWHKVGSLNATPQNSCRLVGENRACQKENASFQKSIFRWNQCIPLFTYRF